jgi:hypothetical protein
MVAMPEPVRSQRGKVGIVLGVRGRYHDQSGCGKLEHHALHSGQSWRVQVFNDFDQGDSVKALQAVNELESPMTNKSR